MHRIHWFDQQVRAGTYPNSSHMAEHFEISRRQAQRDLEYMEVSLHAPLLYVAKYRGYCYEDTTYVLPHLYMTEEEKKVLKYLAHRYRQYNYENRESANRIASLLDRFTDPDVREMNHRIPTFDMNPRIIQLIEKLSFAIQESRIMIIMYKDHEREQQLRICPLKLISQYYGDELIATSEHDQEYISFRVDGILYAHVTTERFTREAEQEVKPWNGQVMTRKPFIAKVGFISPLEGDSWHGYRILAQDELVYDIAFYDTDSFLMHLLIAKWNELIAPQWLKHKLQVKCQETLNRLHVVEEDHE
ncbi:helix-turn-helix transcriptional regulator [Paenibacillus selenitireducens]|nr:WYL domain-containing protein [Paenibacillus selenitireducens]